MEGVIPSAWGRGLAFVVLCLVPQFWETATVLASLIFVGSVALLVLGLSRAPRTTVGRCAELAAVAMLGLSGPLVVFFSPLFAYRWWRDRTRYNALLTGVVAVTAAVELWVFAHSGRVAATYSFDRLPRAYVQRIPALLDLAAGGRRAVRHGWSAAQPRVFWLLAVVALITVELGRWCGGPRRHRFRVRLGRAHLRHRAHRPVPRRPACPRPLGPPAAPARGRLRERRRPAASRCTASVAARRGRHRRRGCPGSDRAWDPRGICHPCLLEGSVRAGAGRLPAVHGPGPGLRAGGHRAEGLLHQPDHPWDPDPY